MPDPAAPRLIGISAPVAQPAEVTYSPVNGLSFNQPYEGTDIVQANAIANSYIAARLPFAYTSDGRTHKIVPVIQGVSADGTGAEVPHDRWEILANENHKDIYESPLALSLEASVPGILGQIRKDLANYNAGKNGTAVTQPPSAHPIFTTSAGLAVDPTIYAKALQLCRLLARGITMFATSQYVLKHTQTISHQYAHNVVDLNIERTYTTGQLLIECATYAFPLPGRMIAKIQDIAAPDRQDEYQWGWRKLPSPEVTLPGNKIEIVTEYYLDQWSTVLYPLV